MYMRTPHLLALFLPFALHACCLSLVSPHHCNERKSASRTSTSLFATQIYCPDPSRPYLTSLFPIPSSDTELPPLIYHIENDGVGDSSLLQLLETETSLPTQYIKDLVAFGACYLAKPKKKASDVYRAARVLPKQLDDQLKTGAYVRLHVNPRRHPLAHTVDWPSRVLFDCADFVVIDKPGGVPISETVDNGKENCLLQMQQVLKQRLFLTSRLDGCTSGVVIFAKSSAASEAFNVAWRQKKVLKNYKVLSQEGVSVGLMEHAFRRKSKSHADAKPTLLRTYSKELCAGEVDVAREWQRCALVVHSCQLLTSMNMHESYIELLTGRTHQVRLQFAACSSPIHLDTRYTPVKGMLDEEGFDGSKLFGPDPKTIGLHCASLKFEPNTVVLPNGIPLEKQFPLSYEARTPWWSTQSG